MARPRPRPLETLLADVLAALSDGRVHVAVPLAAHQPDYGCVLSAQHAETMALGEAANLIDAIVHDAVHAARPEWSEHGVRVHASRILNRLSRREIERIYVLYCRSCRSITP